MRRYIARRLLQLIPILLGLTFMAFWLMDLAPGDPAQKKLLAQGIPVSQEVLDQTREDMGLNRPFLERYGSWLAGLCRGDLGLSFKDNRPVSEKLAKGLEKTVILASASLLLALLVSIPLGILAALKREGPVDHIIRLFSFVGNSLPNFFISVVLMYIFCIRLKLLPIIAQNNVKGLLLPCLALSIPMMGRFIRQVRAEFLEQLTRDYVRGARARGVKEAYIIFKNVLRNASMSILTIVGLAVGTLMGGSVVIETIFNWKGVGKLVMDAITDRDYPVIQGFVVLMAIVYVVLNLLIDISYRFIDPRVDGVQG